MTNSIEKIIELDKQARMKVSEANQQAKKMIDDAESRKNKMREDYTLRAEKRLGIVKESYGKMADEEIAKIEERKKAVFARLDESMNSNKAKWESEILARIIG